MYTRELSSDPACYRSLETEESMDDDVRVVFNSDKCKCPHLYKREESPKTIMKSCRGVIWRFEKKPLVHISSNNEAVTICGLCQEVTRKFCGDTHVGVCEVNTFHKKNNNNTLLFSHSSNNLHCSLCFIGSNLQRGMEKNI